MRNFAIDFAALVMLCALPLAAPLSAQDHAIARPAIDSTHRNRLLQRHDLLAAAIVGLSTAAVMPFDKRLNEGFQDPTPQTSTFLQKNASFFNTLGSPGVLIASAGLWGVGHVVKNRELVRLGGHTGTAIIASAVASTALKLLIGRQRPFVESGDAFDFAPLHGTHSGRSSLPSGHTTAAFAFASSLATDLRVDHPAGARIAVPLLYIGAASVGAARMYSNKHWMSDVVMGAGIGTLIGHRTVTYSRSHPGGWFGRVINGVSVAPTSHGLAAAVTLR